MKLIGLVRLGRDAELRYAPSGEPVAAFSGAFNFGRRADDGGRPTQWVEFSLWGDRAERLAPHLLKGQQLLVVAGDPHIETYEKREGGGTGFKLVARVDSVEFAGERPEKAEGGGDRPARQRQDVPPATAQRQARAPAAKSGSGFDDMEDDIPF